jgi:hypothetical protein
MPTKPRAQKVYLLQVSPRVCECVLPARELATASSLKNIEEKGGFYWQLFLSFFGDMNPFLQFTIVDTRDGTVMWRNGRRENKEMWDGESQA